jgi:shikimate kinase
MNLVLTGFMGTGKSALGRILAQRLGYRFLDADALIEAEEGMPIPEIFTAKGEEYFRQCETRLAQRLAGEDRKVIATGGGFVLNPENIRQLRTGSVIINLSATPEAIYGRVKACTHRPLLAVADPLAEIRKLLEVREPFYREADLILDTNSAGLEELAEEVLTWLESGRMVEWKS